LAVFLACLPACQQAQDNASRETAALAGSRVRVVWCQDLGEKGTDLFADRAQLRLMGMDTGDGRGERAILSAPGNYAKPLFTSKGDRVVFSDRQARRFHVVNWDGSGLRDMGVGFALDTWGDPADGQEWVYYASDPIAVARQDVKAYGAIFRRHLDGAAEPEMVWNRTMLSQLAENNFQVSSDGTYASLITPFGLGVARLPNGAWENFGAGCWPSVAPGPVFVFWHCNGDHRTATLYEREGANRRTVAFNTAPGVEGLEVFHPRWSNHPRFFAVTGPLRVSGGGPGVEVYVGRFDARLDAVEAWARVTRNDRADFLPDVWIENSPLAVELEARSAPAVAADPSHLWPVAGTNLVFLWADPARDSGMVQPPVGAPYAHRVEPKGLAWFGRNHRLELRGGRFEAKLEGARLAEAFRRSGELTFQCVVKSAAAQQGTGCAVSLAGTEGEEYLALTQKEGRFAVGLRNAGGAATVPAQTLEMDAGVVSESRTVLVTVVCRSGAATVYRGRRVVASGGWKPVFGAVDRLLFGAAPDGQASWGGSLEGIVFYDRGLTDEEVLGNVDLFRALAARRKPVEAVVVTARLEKSSEVPTPAAIRPYRRSLAVNLYTVVEAKSGNLAGKRINVAQWVILDDQVLPTSSRKPGSVHVLTLESAEDNPQLESERLSRDAEELGAPLYFDTGISGSDRYGGNLAPAR
jgi:hypothetical protein